MAVLTARAVAERLVRIKKLSSLYHEEVAQMRIDAVTTTVNALWRRYVVYKRRSQTNPTFIDWLADKKHFEETYWPSTSLPARRRWAFQYFNFLTRKEITLGDDPSNNWMFGALERAINAKHDDPNWVVVVEAVPRNAIPRYQVKEGTSFTFSLRLRPEHAELELEF